MNIDKHLSAILTTVLTLIAGTAFGAGNPVRNDALSSEVIVLSACTAVTALTPACTYVPLDLIGDGSTDMLVGNNNGEDLQLYPGDGTGGFGSYTALASGVRASGLRVVDLDGDGNLDIVKSVRGDAGDLNLFYTGDGAGNFFQGNISGDADRSTSIDIGDIDGDGLPDVIVSNTRPNGAGPVWTSNKAYRNTSVPGTISFAAAVAIDPVNAPPGTGSGDNSRRIVLLDIDQDGKLDAVAANDDQTANDNRVYMNTSVVGTISFAAPVNLTASLADDGEITNTLIAADLDNDGDTDLVATNFGQANRYYINNTPALGAMDFDTTNDTFGSPTDLSTNVRAGDLDGDGDMDLVTTTNPGTNRVHMNLFADPNRFGDPAGADDDPTGQGFLLVDPVLVEDPLASFANTRGLDLGDLNADGFPDLITANRDGQLNLRYLNNALDPTNIDGDVCPASPGPPADGCHPFRNMTPRPDPIPADPQNNTPSTPEDTLLTLLAADLDILDPDNTPGDWNLIAQAGTNYTVSADGLSITPDPNYNGPLTVSVRITDQEETSPNPAINFAVSVGAEEDAPQFTSLAVLAGTQDAAYTYNIVASDGDGDAVTITAPTLPAWLTFTPGAPGTATLTGTPTNAEVGDHAVSLAVTDPAITPDPDIGANQDFTITVANVNDAPSFTSSPVTGALEASVYTYAITTTDPDAAPPETLTITAATALPGWLTLVDAGDGTATLSGTPGGADVGPVNVTLQVQDLGGAPAVQQPFTITVAAAPVIVPDVVDTTQAAATTAIEALGLTVTVGTPANHATIAAGNVISQNPAALASVAPGSAVTIVVSSGPANVIVPDVVDTTEAAATTAIEALGLTVTVGTPANHATIAAGNVISQNPAALAAVAPGSAVTIVVSSGPTPTPTPRPASTGGGGSTGLGELAGLGFLAAFGAIRRRRRDRTRG